MLYLIVILLTALQTDGGSVANHPNLWFNVSTQYHKVKSGKLDTSASSAETGPPATDSAPMDVATQE